MRTETLGQGSFVPDFGMGIWVMMLSDIDVRTLVRSAFCALFMFSASVCQSLGLMLSFVMSMLRA